MNPLNELVLIKLIFFSVIKSHLGFITSSPKIFNRDQNVIYHPNTGWGIHMNKISVLLQPIKTIMMVVVP